MTRVIRSEELPIGARLARDVLSGHATSAPLLRAGAVITERYREALERAGIGGVYIDDEESEGIEIAPALNERTRLSVSSALTDAFSEVPEAIAAGRTLQRRTVTGLQDLVSELIEEVAQADLATLVLQSLAGADAYTLEHSIDVTVLGLLIANHLFNTVGRIDHTGKRTSEGVDEAMRRLGIGLLLHDIGKIALPADILRKPGPLDADEQEIVRRHPMIGVRLVDGGQFSAHALAVVRSHHERFDGSGYPNGCAGTEIPQFARIAAVADVYSAMTTRRSYHESIEPHLTLMTLRKAAGTHFDPEVIDALAAVVAPYPPGSSFTFADGRRGVVVRVARERLDRLRVRVLRNPDGAPVEPYEVDLTFRHDLTEAA